LVLVHCVKEGLSGDGALATISIKSLLFLCSPVGEEVVTNSRSVLGVGVPLFDEFINVGEVLETHVELLERGVGLVLFGQELHELEGSVVKS